MRQTAWYGSVWMAALLLPLWPAAALAQTPAPSPAPAQAQATPSDEELDNYLTGYYARNFGGDLFKDDDDHRKGTDGFGVAYTFWGKGALSAELDFGYNPRFFGDDDSESDNNLITFTVNGIIGGWIHAGDHRIRPYAVIGGGLMRSKIEEFAILGKDVKNKGLIDAGGGLLFLGSSPK